MAISFPRDFPTLPRMFRSGEFELREVVFQNTLGGLKTQIMRTADPRWTCNYATPPLKREHAQVWKAWKASLAGTKYFYGYDPEQPYPLNYPNGFTGMVKAGTATTFTGTDVDVTARTSSTISLAELAANFVFKAGDLVGLVEGTNRQVHRVLEDVTANSSGVAVVTVEPYVKTTIFSTSAVVNLVRPKVKMFLDPESWSAPRDIEAGPVNFTGIQAVY